MGDNEPKSTKPTPPEEKDDAERAESPRADDVASSPPITESVLDELLATIDGEILKFVGMVDGGKKSAEPEPAEEESDAESEPTGESEPEEEAVAEPDPVEPLSVAPQGEADPDSAEPPAADTVTPNDAAAEEAEALAEQPDTDPEPEGDAVDEVGEEQPVAEPAARDEEPAPETVTAGESAEEVPRESVVMEGEADTILDELVASIDEELQQSSESGLEIAGEQREARVGEEEQHIIFTLADTEYAVSARNIMEVGEVLNITALPNVPPWLLGVANLRGDIISMVDLRDFFGLEQRGYLHDDRMLVARTDNDEVVVGLIVDRVSAIRFLPKERILETAAPLEDRVAPYLRGVIEHEERTLAVLDVAELLLSPEMQQFQPA